MHIRLKRQILSIIDTMYKLQEMLSGSVSTEDRWAILEKCQQTAITVGEKIEQTVIEDRDIVPLLEEYCEIVFNISQEENLSNEGINLLRDKLSVIKDHVSNLSEKYRVVFMPYKAEMWDSLESIWKACMDDERCECDVVPMPYFELNRVENKWESRYDGERFPDYVKITSIEYYNLEEMQPDVIYIHNPYDDCNLITTVHPQLYSGELKKYTKNLVYVPYYVTTGHISQEFQHLPVYKNADYIVFQSEYTKGICNGLYYYDKILPLGSPKLDKIIQKCKSGVSVPAEWKTVIGDKKVLMLNTTIGDVLNYGAVLFDKLYSFFELIMKQEEVALIYRPHPLLEATLKSMRPELIEPYQDLLEFYKNKAVGILDTTPDISDTIAIADGYVGSSASVINLFGASGKPLFLFNYMYHSLPSDEDRRRVRFLAATKIEDRIYLISQQATGIFTISVDDLKKIMARWKQNIDQDKNADSAIPCVSVRWNGRPQGEPKWRNAYDDLKGDEHGLYLSPVSASEPVFYSLKGKKEYIALGGEGRSIGVNYGNIILADDWIYFLPINQPVLMRYNHKTSVWEYDMGALTALWDGCARTNEPYCYDGIFAKERVWITTAYTNRVLEINVNTGRYVVHHIEEETRGYSGIVYEDDQLVLADSQNAALVFYNPDKRESVVKTIDVADISIWGNPIGKTCIFKKILSMNNQWILVPYTSNKLVSMDKKTMEIRELAKDFFETCSESTNGYVPKFVSACGAVVVVNEDTIMVQRGWDDKMSLIDVLTGEYVCFDALLDEDGYKELLAGENGFEKVDSNDGFYRYESPIWDVQSYMTELAGGKLDEVREQQVKNLATLANNLDGTCGEKVHSFLMDVLEKEE